MTLHLFDVAAPTPVGAATCACCGRALQSVAHWDAAGHPVGPVCAAKYATARPRVRRPAAMTVLLPIRPTAVPEVGQLALDLAGDDEGATDGRG
jgi:hypothetical protein